MQIGNIFTESLLSLLGISLGAPLLFLLILGFISSFLQAITQIQDQIFSFAPKVILLVILIILSGERTFDLYINQMENILYLIRHVK